MNLSGQKSLSRYWLLIGVTALAIAGLFSLVLVAGRSPETSDIAIFTDWFHRALVVHVDLSVLVWFLSIACMLWSLLAKNTPQPIAYLEESALLCFAFGTLAMAVSPFSSTATLMSNYIPVIHSPLFFFGLALLLCGVTLMLVRVSSAITLSKEFTPIIRYALTAGGMMTAMAGICFTISFRNLPPEIDGTQYYDIGFWGGGHVLQFLHTQMVLVCWYLLIKAIKPDFSFPYKLLVILFSIGLIAVATAPLAYRYDVISQDHRLFFTHMMEWGNGIAPIVLGLCILPALFSLPDKKSALWMSLIISILLFFYGGILAEMIAGQNVVIPAHYHGSIVGITLAFMAVAYLFLPQFGYADVSRWKLAYWQPILYGTGQLMHVTGLAWSGGYGVLRKTPGGVDALPANVKAALGLMGLGGTLAIIGGFMFVIVVYRAVRRPQLIS